MSSVSELELSAQSLVLARKHNESTPFGSLPTELLVSILRYVVVSTRNPGGGSWAFRNLEDTLTVSLTWSRVMLVCSRIREIALSVPELWSYIHCEAPLPWIRLCQERAGTYPLLLRHFHDEFVTEDRVWGVLSPLEEEMVRMIPKARFVDISITLGIPDAILAVLQNHLPCLQGIHLHIIDYPLITPIAGPSNSTLTRLTLTQVCFDPSMTFPALVHLGLHIIACSGSFVDLLHFLSRSPLLEVIILNDTNMDDPDVDDTSLHMTISCPHLRILIADEESFSIAWCLLRALPNPLEGLYLNTTKLQEPDDPEEMRRFQLPVISGSADDAFRRRVIQYWNSITGKASLGKAWMDFSDGEPCLNFGQEFDRDTAPPSLFLRIQVNIVRGSQDSWLTDVRNAHYQIEGSQLLWPHFQDIDVLPNLQSIQVEGYITDDSISPIEDWMRSRQQHGGHPIDWYISPGTNEVIPERINQLKLVAERLRREPCVSRVVIDLGEDVSEENVSCD